MGRITLWLRYLLPDPAAPGLIPSIPQIVSEEKTVNVAEVNQWCYLEESGLRLENVDQTHIELASSRLVVQKVFVANLLVGSLTLGVKSPSSFFSFFNSSPYLKQN